MPWWLYKGRVTTPVDIPGKGPTVLEPRMVFEAPVASVSNLVRIGHVVKARPPKRPKPAPAPTPEPTPEVVTKAPEPVVAPKAVESGAPAGVTVVASAPSEPEPKKEVDPAPDEAGEGDTLDEGEEKEKEEGTKKRRGRRGR